MAWRQFWRFVIRIGLPAAVLAALFVHGCVAPRERAPGPPPQASVPPPPPVPAPAPPPPPATSSAPASWADLPDTPGAWRYRESGGLTQALFSSGAGEDAFVVRCDPSTRVVRLLRAGNAGSLGLRTSSEARTLPARPTDGAFAGAELQPRDPLLDAMAFSRGHFTVDAPGLPRLVLPAHPEVARVVEDCRT